MADTKEDSEQNRKPLLEPSMFTVGIIERDGYRVPVLRTNARAFTLEACDDATAKKSCTCLVLRAEFNDFCSALRAELMQALANRFPCVIVDLQDVTSIDETGSGELVHMYKAVGQGFALAFVAPTRFILVVFELCHFDDLLLIYPDVEIAMSEIGQHAKPRTTGEWRRIMNCLLAGAAAIRQMAAERGPSGTEPITFELQQYGDGACGVPLLRLHAGDYKSKALLRTDLQEFVVPLVLPAVSGAEEPCPCVIVDWQVSHGDQQQQWLVAEVLLGLMIERSAFWVVVFVGEAPRTASRTQIRWRNYVGALYPDAATAVAEIRRNPRPRTRAEYFDLMERLFEDTYGSVRLP